MTNEYEKIIEEIERGIKKLSLYDELVGEYIDVLNQDDQILYTGIVSTRDIDEVIDLILKGCVYHIK